MNLTSSIGEKDLTFPKHVNQCSPSAACFHHFQRETEAENWAWGRKSRRNPPNTTFFSLLFIWPEFRLQDYDLINRARLNKILRQGYVLNIRVVKNMIIFNFESFKIGKCVAILPHKNWQTCLLIGVPKYVNVGNRVSLAWSAEMTFYTSTLVRCKRTIVKIQKNEKHVGRSHKRTSCTFTNTVFS